MPSIKSLYLFFLLPFLYACDGSNEFPTDIPETYTFERNSLSTVNFSGQTARIRMAEELSDALLDNNSELDNLIAMYRNRDADGNDANPFMDDDLNASVKSLRNKAAASYDYFFTNNVESIQIKEDLQSFIENQHDEVFPSWNRIASAGQAGQILDGSAVRYINAQGLEFNQLFDKSLLGALMLDQMLNNYLSNAVLDAGDNLANNAASILEADKNYTTMEHKWDEAYGYVFGNMGNYEDPLWSLGSDDSFLNKYLARVDNDPDFAGIAQTVYEAFITGRYAITQNNLDHRNMQAEIIKEKMSEVIGVRAVFYLQQAKHALENNPNAMGTVFHELSEAYGFIYSLRFTRKPNSGAPYFSKAEVDSMLADLLDDGIHGLWDVRSTTLQDLSDTITDRFEFTLEEAAEL